MPDRSLIAPVIESFARHADRTAIVDADGRTVTYGELETLSAGFAARFQDAGVRDGDRVGVCRPKSIETVAAFIGALRIGAAFVPVDHAAPVHRNEHIFNDCDVALHCDESLLPLEGSGSGAEVATDPDRLAYILYTSGSTGLPKGVPLTHRNAASFVDWCVRTLKPRVGDVFSSHASFHFDLSVLDLWVPLWTGGSIAITPADVAQDPRRLPNFIVERGITNWYSVPSILALMVEFGRLEDLAFDRLRTICFAGEVFPLPMLRRLRKQLPEVRLLNLYGPTETNVCTWYEVPDRIDSDRTDPMPIGTACDHCDVALFDDAGQRVDESGQVARILARGAPVMNGYWGRVPEETPSLLTIDGQDWYDTGDLGEWDQGREDERQIVFRGRRDRMVKRHGYRIELGEVEAGLDRHPDVQESAVWSGEIEGRVVIHAAVVPRDGASLGVIPLKLHCAAALLSWMSPDRFQIMDALPRTSTGKVDYVALRGA
jgi:amino acid adenylation domain-containing protein